MNPLLIVAALVLSIQGAGAQDTPPVSRIEAFTKGVRDWVPPIPLPDPPTMPTISLPTMPDFSMPDFSRMGDGLTKEFSAFTQQIADSLPILEEMGYEVAIFRVQWGLPPKAKLRLRSKGAIDPTTLPAMTAKASGGMLMTALISSAAAAKQIQTTMKLGTAIIDVDFALPPKVRMSFLKSNPDNKDAADRNVEDLDLACGVALAAN